VALVSLLLGGAAGCAVGPDYTPPGTELLPFHNLADPSTAAARQGPPLDRWWTGFGDPVLVTVVERALDENMDVARALARVLQARAAAAGAGAKLLPSADLGASGGYEHQSLRGLLGSIAGGQSTYHRDVSDVAVGPSASWEIDLFGGLRRGAAASRDEAQAAEADEAGARVVVAADAADAYFQVRGYEARLEVAKDQIENDERLLGLVRNRNEAGYADALEVAEAEALLKQARASVPPLRIAREQQLNRLDVLVGAQPGSYARRLEPGSVPTSVPEVPGEERPCDVLRRRPDVIAAERRLAAADERIGAALAGYYPKVSLAGLLGFDSLGGKGLFSADAFHVVGGGALEWRVFDFGKVDAEVAKARGANAEALAVYRQAVLRAVEDVENALVMLRETQVRVAELEGQVQALTRARDLAEHSYREGVITLTDVLDANRQLLTARDELDANRAGGARAAVGVFRALGGGWDSEGSHGVR
jgi:NodT family efflux transporter outer membrane factor (OMF) lipoprotein